MGPVNIKADSGGCTVEKNLHHLKNPPLFFQPHLTFKGLFQIPEMVIHLRVVY